MLLPTRRAQLPVRRSNRTRFYLDASRRVIYNLNLVRRDARDAQASHIVNPALQRFKFGPNFRRCVKCHYTDISSCVIINGCLSRRIHPSRGVRQRCPLSPILYVIVSATFYCFDSVVSSRDSPCLGQMTVSRSVSMPTTPMSLSLRTRTSMSLDSALARTNSEAVLDSTLLNPVDSFSGLGKPVLTAY